MQDANPDLARLYTDPCNHLFAIICLRSYLSSQLPVFAVTCLRGYLSSQLFAVPIVDNLLQNRQ